MTAVMGSYQGPFDRVRTDLREMSGGGQGGQYYVTHELQKQLNQVEDAVDHVQLDDQFLASSKVWRDKYNPGSLAAEKAGANQAVERAAGTMATVKNYMGTENVMQLQDNQVREIHHWASNNLNNINQDMDHYKQKSVDRIQRFCDYVGVTDQYDGFRNNFNRGSRDPVRMGFKWLDNRTPNSFNRSLNVGWKPPARPATAMYQSSHGGYQSARAQVQSAPACRNFTTKQTNGVVSSLDVRHSGVTMQRPQVSASIQEQCGINTTFPGPTEYQTRYFRPPLDRPTRNFTINPRPDFSIYGRPIMQQEYIPKATEYQSRYEWPDGSRITKLPWLKK